MNDREQRTDDPDFNLEGGHTRETLSALIREHLCLQVEGWWIPSGIPPAGTEKTSELNVCMRPLPCDEHPRTIPGP